MNKKEDNNNENIMSDILLSGGILTLSYSILYYFPDELSFKFWICLGVSAFLFCIGFFWLVASIPEPKGKAGAMLFKVVFVIGALGPFLLSVLYVYYDNGSDRSLGIATLMLIESIVVFGVSQNYNEACQISAEQEKLFIRVFAVIMIIIGGKLFWQEIMGEPDGNGRIETATMLFISAATLYIMEPETVKKVTWRKKDKSKNTKS